ncbi:hypothetical protein DM01DRAFT_1330726 [Hesseltinella vesiculosa]|uniref:Uncharacterized protein n=1 Tax=Hesseltinella vesiculosa TaxID=101127 RepID=A0A1X2GWZ2_9FUNG|nr:hypothetical protein DM01DRAFT_1330726 [Hesseltinella vesiculosa]
MCDQSWLEAIEITLHQAPPALFSTFKELVGYMGQDSTLQNQSLDQDTPFQHVELGAIRRHPSCLNHLFTNYPQFMINCQQALSEKDMIQLEHLLSPEASSLDDVQWKHQLNLCLTTSNLLDQFKEIAAYEVYDDL